MKHSYDIPDARIRSTSALFWMPIVCTVLLLILIRHLWFISAWSHYRLIAIVWTVASVFAAVQWALSWMEKPYGATDGWQRRLDRMKVTVNVPVYNEDRVVLDRVLYALFSQSRLPDKIEVIDDGSDVDYTDIWRYWSNNHPRYVEFSWMRQSNLGKKRAQARTFAADDADIFITVDSDTTLARDAIREGLKPFADRRVQSVAGIELAWNHDTNLLTRLKSVNTVIWQFVTCSAQHVMGGNVLVNRGTFALYRAAVIRDNVDLYINETFFGRPFRLGDDSMLTLLALGRGRAVQQQTAVCFSVYPETLSHTLRQWTRWMRGTSVRTLWRLKYLPMLSWGWWYNFLTTWWYFAFIAVLVAGVVDWRVAWKFIVTALIFSSVWVWIIAFRCLMVRRSDHSWLQVLEMLALVPLATAWMAFVLRPIRVYGNVTMLRHGWVTRQRGAESLLSLEADVEMEGVA
jgi:hyaluronan synthase